MTGSMAESRARAGLASSLRTLLLPHGWLLFVAYLALVALWSDTQAKWSLVVLPMWIVWLRHLARSHCDGHTLRIPQMHRDVGIALVLAALVSVGLFALNAWVSERMDARHVYRWAWSLAAATVLLLSTPIQIVIVVCGAVFALAVVMSLRFATGIDATQSLPDTSAPEPWLWLWLSAPALAVLAGLQWRRMLNLGWESGKPGNYPVILAMFPAAPVERHVAQRTNWLATLHAWRVAVTSPKVGRTWLQRILRAAPKRRTVLLVAYWVVAVWLWVRFEEELQLLGIALLLLPEWVRLALSLARLKMVDASEGTTSELIATLPASAAPAVWRQLVMRGSYAEVAMFALFSVYFLFKCIEWLSDLVLG